MSPNSRIAALLAGVASALCLASGAMAQPPSPPPAPGDDAHPHGDREAWREAHEARRARFLHDVLSIRADQESAFQTFLADMRPPARDHKDWAEHKDADAAPMTTPERLDRMAAMMARHDAEHQAEMQHRVEAVKRFYAVLNPEQKRAFDALHDRGGMGGPGRHGPGRHEGGPDDHPGGPDGHEHGGGETGA
jgi:Spy/CpxP family protein refolding chaperone